MSATQLYGIRTQTYQKFGQLYDKIKEPGVPFKGYQFLTPVQLAAITAHEAALRYFATAHGQDCFEATDPAGFNLMHHVTIANERDSTLFTKITTLLNQLFPGLVDELMTKKSHAGEGFPYTYPLSPRQLLESLHPPFDPYISLLEESGAITRLSQEQFQRQFGFLISPSRMTLSPEVIVNVIRAQLIESTQTPEEKSQEHLFSFMTHANHVVPSTDLALRRIPQIGKFEVVYIGKKPLEKGAVIPYGGTVIPKPPVQEGRRAFPCDMRLYLKNSPWPRATLVPEENQRSFAMLLRQGPPNCDFEFVTLPTPREPSQMIGVYEILESVKPGTSLTFSCPESLEIAGKFYLPPYVWKEIQNKPPKVLRELIRSVSPDLSKLQNPPLANISFYFLNITVILYLFLQGKIPHCSWKYCQSFYDAIQDTQLGLSPQKRLLVEKCYDAISQFPPSTKQMVSRFLENNVMSTSSIISFVIDFSEPSFWRPEKEPFLTQFGNLLDLIYELSNGALFDTALSDPSPKPLPANRIGEIESEITALLTSWLPQASDREKEYLCVYLSKNLKALYKAELPSSWDPIKRPLENFFNALLPGRQVPFQARFFSQTASS